MLKETVEMNYTNSLAGLLESHMKSASIGDARLANQINAMMDNPYFIHRSTIRNWRTGSVKKINNWRQLVMVAIALRLDKTEANALLENGGCPSIQAINVTAQEADQKLLSFWQNDLPRPAGCTTTKDEVTDTLLLPAIAESESRGSKFGLPKLNKQALLAPGLGAVLVFSLLSHLNLLPKISLNNSGNLLVNSSFDNGSLGWITYVKDAALADFSVSDGTLRLQIKQTAKKSWHIALNQRDIEVTAGEIYTVRFRVRGVQATSMQVDITRVTNPKTSLSFENSGRKIVPIPDQWTTKFIEFEVIETISLKDGGARLFFRFGRSEKGWIELDDIELFKGIIEQPSSAPFQNTEKE